MTNELNIHHPELKEGEVFLTNVSNDDMSRRIMNSRETDWEAIGWKTKRLGNIAYDIYNKIIVGMFPVFVQRSELQKSGIDPDKLR